MTDLLDIDSLGRDGIEELHSLTDRMVEVSNRPIPTKTNPIGAKGCGEAGTSGGLPTVVSAVYDALSEYGITELEMPMTASRIWEAIEKAKSKQAA